MVKITLDDMERIRSENKDKKIVFCSGSFDLVHVGHIIFFENCKNLGDILIVGVGSDFIIRKNKGDKRPVLNENVRIKAVDSLKPVDYTILDVHSTKENPLYLIDVVFEKLKPDVYAVNEDAFDLEYRKRLCEKMNVELIVLPRYCPPEFDNISTSQIIEKIKAL